ncbi:MAG: peptide ABC transporter substrate-binding protein [Chlamydiota bacterium]
MKLSPIATFLLLVLSACYPPKTQEDTKPVNKAGAVARINLVTEPQTLDPRRSRDLQSVTLIRMFFEGLTRVNASEKADLALAESVEISSDLKKYSFKIRESFWNNGDPVTAHDFVYAWKKVLDPYFSADNAFQLYVIKGAKAAKAGAISLDDVGIHIVNDHLFEVELEAPTPYFLELLAMPIFFPVNRLVDQKNPRWAESPQTFISNGPFLISAWQHQHLLVASKNPQYWDEEVVELDEVHFVMVPSDTELKMFEKRELDWAGSPLSSLPVDALRALKKEVDVYTKSFLGTDFLRCNIEHPLLAEPHFRKALALAIHRRELAEHIYQGGQMPAMGFVPLAMGLQESPYFADGDDEGAKILFDKALCNLGLKLENIPEITFIYPAGDRPYLLAQAIEQQWFNTFGIRIKLEAMERQVYLDRVSKRNYDIAFGGWTADFNDPINFLEVFKYSKASTNNTGWEDKEYVRFLDASSQESDVERRKHFLSMSEKILMDAMPIIPLCECNMLYLNNNRLKNVLITSMGTIDFKWAQIEEQGVSK